MEGIKFLGFGRCIPERVVTNDEISAGLETNDEWIRTRTGIENRRFIDGKTNNYEMAARAAEDAIKSAGISKEEIGFIICGTLTPDFATPSMACMIQHELDIPETCTCFDVNGACSGFMFSILTARGMMLQAKEMDETKPLNALVIGTEVLSRKLDREDRGTCILFGDGAGAAVITLDNDNDFYYVTGSKGDYSILSCGEPFNNVQHIKMLGSDVFKFAVRKIPECIEYVLEKSGLTMEEIDHCVCHQANARIIDAAMKKYPGMENKFYKNIQKYGNTSAASIPICLSEMYDEGILKSGQKIICVGFGAGLTWGAILMDI